MSAPATPPPPPDAPPPARAKPARAKRVLPVRANYAGTHFPTLDAKNRLTIPAKWRSAGDEEDTAYLAVPHENGSITVYPKWMVDIIMDRLGGVSFQGDHDESLALQQTLAGADQFGCDAQGRIVLSEQLRRHAGLGREAVLSGTLNVFHIWEPSRHAAYIAAPPGRRVTQPAVLKRFGF